MKVHLIKKKTIEQYVESYASGRSSFRSWLSTLNYADWSEPKDMLSTFNSADLLGKSSNRVVFNIGGNNHRIICSYYFGKDQDLLTGSVRTPNMTRFVVKECNIQ